MLFWCEELQSSKPEQDRRGLSSMQCTSHKTILNSMKMLDSILFMFNEKHVEEKWHSSKTTLLFEAQGGESFFASMMEMYLNIVVNMFEFSPKDQSPQLWLRRSAMEACFKLL